MDTENRIEKAFHDQTKYLQQNMTAFTTEIHRTSSDLTAQMHQNSSGLTAQMHQNNTELTARMHQLILAILGVGVALVVAVFFK